MNPHEFTARYGRTLHTDPDTKENYLKLPVADASELAYMQEALLQAIQLLTQTEGKHKKESQNSIYWLSKILLAGYPGHELEGLAEWLKNE